LSSLAFVLSLSWQLFVSSISICKNEWLFSPRRIEVVYRRGEEAR
jgi:hypothetical protein